MSREDRVQEMLERAPEQVRKIFEALRANAKKAQEPNDCVYFNYSDGSMPWESSNEEWVIGDNYERYSFSFVYRPDVDKWFYRATWSGEDRPIPDGFNGALAAVSIWYTG